MAPFNTIQEGGLLDLTLSHSGGEADSYNDCWSVSNTFYYYINADLRSSRNASQCGRISASIERARPHLIFYHNYLMMFVTFLWING